MGKGKTKCSPDIPVQRQRLCVWLEQRHYQKPHPLQFIKVGAFVVQCVCVCFLLEKTHFLCHVSDKESTSATSTGLYANQTCTNKSVFKRNFGKNIYVSKLAFFFSRMH